MPEIISTHNKYKDKGFTVLAFPANNFGGQEPGSDEEIRAICKAFGIRQNLF